MINFDDELARFQECRDIENIEDEILDRDLTDMTDVLISMIEQAQNEKR